MTRIIVLLVIFWQPVYELKLDPLQLPQTPFDKLRDRGFDRLTHREVLP